MPPGRTRRTLGAALLVTAMTTSCTSFEPVTETVRAEIEFESLDFEGRLWDPLIPPLEDGAPLIVTGRLTVPPTTKPVPAVVVTHGCGGPGLAEARWAADLEEAGYASLIVESFRARGIDSICEGDETVSIAAVLVDLYRAADAVSAHPAIDGVAVMGLSFGGRTSLWSALDRFQEAYAGGPFDAYLAFYPAGCFIRLVDDDRVSGGPIRIFHGTADDWLPIDDCRAMVDRLDVAGVDAGLFEYAGAHHGFDNSALPEELYLPEAISPRNCDFHEREGVIFDDSGVAATTSPCVESGVTVGHDPEARARAVEDVVDFLDDVFSR